MATRVVCTLQYGSACSRTCVAWGGGVGLGWAGGGWWLVARSSGGGGGCMVYGVVYGDGGGVMVQYDRISYGHMYLRVRWYEPTYHVCDVMGVAHIRRETERPIAGSC